MNQTFFGASMRLSLYIKSHRRSIPFWRGGYKIIHKQEKKHKKFGASMTSLFIDKIP